MKNYTHLDFSIGCFGNICYLFDTYSDDFDSEVAAQIPFVGALAAAFEAAAIMQVAFELIK